MTVKTFGKIRAITQYDPKYKRNMTAIEIDCVAGDHDHVKKIDIVFEERHSLEELRNAFTSIAQDIQNFEYAVHEGEED